MADAPDEDVADVADVAAQRFQQRLAALSPSKRTLLEKRLRDRNLDASSIVDIQRDGPEPVAKPANRRRRRDTTRMGFSLFFFSGDGSVEGPGKYQLLLDTARYADANGYAGIWVPERHFVDFGGLYPNPSVLAAAIAVLTERIQVRAGSAVLPLHHPVRVAEEWAVVDNLSGGRAAISAASGWHPKDFILAGGDGAAKYRTRKDDMFTAMEVVQQLWAGRTVELPGPDGAPQQVRTLPRPLQPRLPMWVSAQGSEETFVRAGKAGANVLTGLVGLRPADLADRISVYRKARAESGLDPATGRVTAMVHTFLGADEATVKQTVREPLIDYLRTFVAQQDNFDSEFAQLDEQGRASMLSATFERYYESLALLGTPDKGESLIEDLADLGVDEVACLVDFGLDADVVLAGLGYLTELKDRYQPGRETLQ